MEIAAFLFLAATLTQASYAADPDAVLLLHKALDAQGGEQKLRALKTLQFEAVGYRNELEQSERPEGPYITDFLTISEVHDLAGNRYRSTVSTSVYPAYSTSTTSIVNGNVAMLSFGAQSVVGSPQQIQLTRERLALSPERLLITALDAGDIRLESDTTLQSVLQNVLVFYLDGSPVRIYLNLFTHLPTAVDYSGPLARTNYFAFLGDVTQRTLYSSWWLAKGGIHLPMQWTVEGNGLPDKMLVIRKLRLDDPVNETDLSIPPEIRAQFRSDAKPVDLELRPLGDPQNPPKEIAPGIIFIPGAWNITIVRQTDGLVILEAPLSAGYSRQVIEEARRRFPSETIKAVITTSDSWPHVAGIREYVAEGIPIYALDLNRPILERMIAAPHTTQPDTLQRAPRKATFQLVHDRLSLGTGSNRLEILPIRGETSERQMMIYFPGRQILYGSDPFQRNPDGTFFYPQTVTELLDAVAREHLDVKQFFMMHIGITPWTDLALAAAAAKDQNTPSGVL